MLHHRVVRYRRAAECTVMPRSARADERKSVAKGADVLRQPARTIRRPVISAPLCCQPIG